MQNRKNYRISHKICIEPLKYTVGSRNGSEAKFEKKFQNIICKKALANKPTDDVLSLLGGMAGVAIVEVTLAEGRDLYSTSSV